MIFRRIFFAGILLLSGGGAALGAEYSCSYRVADHGRWSGIRSFRFRVAHDQDPAKRRFETSVSGGWSDNCVPGSFNGNSVSCVIGADYIEQKSSFGAAVRYTVIDLEFGSYTQIITAPTVAPQIGARGRCTPG